MKKLLFALMLACVTATASAACQKFNPDGTIEACQHMPFGAPLSPPAPEQASANPCQLGGMLAYRAYLYATPDALYPSANALHYAVDYWGDMMVVKHDRKMAHRAVEYVAIRMQATGMRKPWEGAVYEAVREFIVRECNK
jgi:hypothetical protein